MKRHENIEGQGALFSLPEADNAVTGESLPQNELERHREERMATPASRALQAALEEEEREGQIDDLAEKLGSYDLARRQLGLESEPSRQMPTSKSREPRRLSVRLRREDEPSESDAYWAMTGNKDSRTPEQRAINARGAELARATLNQVEFDRIARLPTESEQLAALREHRLKTQIKKDRAR